MESENIGKGKYAWAGPALFTAVSIALLVFFWWLLIASNPGH